MWKILLTLRLISVLNNSECYVELHKKLFSYLIVEADIMNIIQVVIFSDFVNI